MQVNYLKIYIDGIFLENIIINSTILFQTAWFLKVNVKKKRIIIASTVGSIYVCIMLLFKLIELNYIFSKISLSILMVYMVFSPKKFKTMLKQIVIFYSISIINLGSFYITTNIVGVYNKGLFVKITLYGISFILSYLLKKYLWKIYSLDIKDLACIYDVEIFIGNKKYKYRGLIDTGNSVKFCGEGVAFLKEKDHIINELNKYEKEKIVINYITIDNKNNIEGYRVENVQIKRKEHKYKMPMILCFSEKIKENLNYDMLLGYDTIEKIGGITL